MDKEFYCKEIGLDCEFLACGKTEEEVLTKASEHAQTIHKIKGFSQDLYETARSAIREGSCDYGDPEETVSDNCSACYEACSDCADECCC
jgi:predicted small metal-binding protein